MATLKERLRMAREEDDVVADQTPVQQEVENTEDGFDIAEVIESEEDTAEMDECLKEIDLDDAALEELDELESEVKTQIDQNNELLNNPMVITPENVQTSQETIKFISHKLGLEMKEIGVTHEMMIMQPISALSISTEDLKEVLSKIWEGILFMLKKCAEWVEMFYKAAKNFIQGYQRKLKSVGNGFIAIGDKKYLTNFTKEQGDQFIKILGNTLWVAGDYDIKKLASGPLSQKTILDFYNTSSAASNNFRMVIEKYAESINKNDKANDDNEFIKHTTDAINKVYATRMIIPTSVAQKLDKLTDIRNDDLVAYSVNKEKVRYANMPTEISIDNIGDIFKVETRKAEYPIEYNKTTMHIQDMTSINLYECCNIVNKSLDVVFKVDLRTMFANAIKIAERNGKEAKNYLKVTKGAGNITDAFKLVQRHSAFHANSMRHVVADYMSNITAFTNAMGFLLKLARRAKKESE